MLFEKHLIGYGVMKDKEYDIYRIYYLDRNEKDRKRNKRYVVSMVVTFLIGLFLMMVACSLICMHVEGLLGQLLAMIPIPVFAFLMWFVMSKVLTRGYMALLQKAVYKVPDAHKMFDIEPLSDPAKMDAWYHEGAICFLRQEDRALDLFYNWLKDTGLAKSERVRLYRVTKEQLMMKYIFLEDIGSHRLCEEYLVFPLSESTMPGKKKEVREFMTGSHNYLRMAEWFAYIVNGTRNEKEYGLIHDYKDQIKDFTEL